MGNDHKNIRDEVLQKIRSGEVSMHSSGYLALRIGMLAFVVLAALVISVLIFNFISFTIRLSDDSQLLGFGPRGIVFFVTMFPWALLAADAILLVIAERLLRRFRFGYKNPALILFAGLAVLTLALGLLIDNATPFNDRMLERAERHHLGPLDTMYARPHPGPPEGGVCRCVVTAIGTSSVTAYNADASTSPIKIQFPQELASATSSVYVGETIFVAGDRDGNTIYAFGFHTMPKRGAGPENVVIIRR
ncbi:MAG: hypothetical protein JO019_02135 [Candidatus Kaiserbacteria bacterium]|nr:hypothetical protein [Candidatus Kaiserbacteria bacterium]